jgi:hypothetical protein
MRGSAWIGVWSMVLLVAAGCGSGGAGSGPGPIATSGPCDGQTCNGHGQCQALDAGPTCACEGGYVSQGVACVGAPTLSPPPRPPRLLSQAEIQRIAGDSPDWSARKGWCDGQLNQLAEPGYVGWDWHDAAVNYATCYHVARFLALDGATVQRYAKKLLALMRVMARDQAYGSPRSAQEFLAVGDGSRKAFTLRMPPAAGAAVKVYLAPLSERAFTYTGRSTTLCADYCFDPVVKVSKVPGGAAYYSRSIDYHEGYPNKLSWISGLTPAASETFYAKVADQAFSSVPAGGASVSGTTLTLASAPSASQAVFVEYMGPDYQQTGNGMGGVDAIKPDSAYPMRSMNVGLAWAFDAMRASDPATELTPALRAEYANLLAREVDQYMVSTGANPYLDEEVPLGNYFVEGELAGAVCTAFAVEDDLAITPGSRDLKALATRLIHIPFAVLDAQTPGGFALEGTYMNGTANDLLKLSSIWKSATTADGAPEDLTAQLRWTANLVPATIHAMKPDRDVMVTTSDGGSQRGSSYDGGDWNSLPAQPLTPVLESFVQYQGDHAMAPFARQALADLGVTVPGATKDYKAGADAFPRSFVTAGTGALYARSDWGTQAVWLSLAVGPIVTLGHEHLDRGHLTLQRGTDYLLKDSGSYGAYFTVPFHNTIAFGAGATPSQTPGDDGGTVTPPKYLDAGEFVYGQEDLTKSSGGAATRATRSVVYVRPDLIVVHDQAQTSSAGTAKHFNLNFGAAISQTGSVFSTVVGASKLFVRSLVPASPAPTITPSGTSISTGNGAFALSGYNFRITSTGQAVDSFLHLFQVTPAAQAQMAASTYLNSTDQRAQGVVVDAGAKRWVILSATSAAQLPGALAYDLPVACPCSHVVGDLVPNTSYRVDVYAVAGGSPTDTFTVGTLGQGVLSFATSDPAAKQVKLTPGG